MPIFTSCLQTCEAHLPDALGSTLVGSVWFGNYGTRLFWFFGFFGASFATNFMAIHVFSLCHGASVYNLSVLSEVHLRWGVTEQNRIIRMRAFGAWEESHTSQVPLMPQNPHAAMLWFSPRGLKRLSLGSLFSNGKRFCHIVSVLVSQKDARLFLKCLFFQ